LLSYPEIISMKEPMICEKQTIPISMYRIPMIISLIEIGK